MKNSPAASSSPARGTDRKAVWREALLVAVCGALFGFAANAISPRGLVLARNYFPKAIPSSPPAAKATNLPPAPATQTTNLAPLAGVTNLAALAPATNRLAAHLAALGLQLVDSNRVVELFRDPRYETETVVFVDARNDREYREGHIPAAFQFDRYHAENYAPTVVPACQLAETIVVYCQGGDCEDSEFTALTLAEIGIPKERLFVYGGGLTEWATNGLPVELGERKSGQMRPTTP